MSGKVTDSRSNPLGFVNVTLLNETDSAYVAGTVTNAEGVFSLQVQGESRYLIRLSYIGYKTYTAPFGVDTPAVFVLEEEAVGLSEVVVRADRPLIKQVEDRLVMDVKNMRQLEGLKGEDLLKYAPRVVMSMSGGISVGNTRATVFVDDRRLSESEAGDYLRNLDAKEIDRIEVQQSAGADKDAGIQGGVIYIYTKTTLVGLSGNIGGYGSTPEAGYYLYRPTTRIYFGTSRWNLYGNYTYSQGRSYSFSETTNNYLHNGTSHFSDSESLVNNRRHLYRVGSMLRLAPRHTLGWEVNGNSSETNPSYSTRHILFTNAVAESDRALSETESVRKADFYNVALYYNVKLDSLNSFLKFLANYNNRSSFSRYEFHTTYVNWSERDLSEQNRTEADGENFSANLDFRKNFYTRWSLRAGGKLSLTERSSRLSVVDRLADSLGESEWWYRENLSSAYLGVTRQITPNLYAYLSLRMEHTAIKGEASNSADEGALIKNYTDWFPYVYFSHVLSKKFSYNLTYRKGIYRPPFSLMNNYSNRVTDVLYDKGNPELRPQFTDVVSLSGKYGKHIFTLSYRHVSNVINSLFEVIDDITYHTNVNNGTNGIFLFDYNYNGNLLPWWHTNFSPGGYYIHIPRSYNRKAFWTATCSWNNRFFIKNWGELSFDFNASSSSIYGNSYSKGSNQLNLAFSRSFFKKALNLRIGAEDIFNRRNMRAHQQVPTLDYHFYSKSQTRRLWCSFTYTFSTRVKVNQESIQNSNSIEQRL